MNKPKLSEADYVRAAASLGVDVAAVKAVCEVEAPGGGFLSTGEPVILFERHKFSQATGGRFDRSHPDISNPKRGGYGKTSAQHGRLARAAELDRNAALKSASWGRFQIMGSNHKAAGHKTLQGFINAMYAGEPEQLDAFVAFIKSDPNLLRALRSGNWALFAYRYNGPAYAENDYDTKLAAAYARAVRA